MSQDNLFILTFAEARQPEYREKKGQGYIEFGERNDYPTYLLELFNKSAKHNAIIRGKVNYITGNGWKSEDPRGQQFIQTQNLDEVSKKVATDLEIFGGAYIEVIWSSIGGQIAYVGHVDYSKVRTNKDNTTFFYKNDWKDRKEETTVIPAFNPKNPQERQILYYKEYRPGLDTYALPGYMGALNYIESDIEVSKHVLGNAQTGFSASKLITLPNGEPSDDEKRNIEKRFTTRFSGSDGKKFILSFVTTPDRKPIVDDLGASDLTKEDFGRVDAMIQQNIFAGHQLTSPSLFGIAEPGKLGSRTEMRDAYEIFKNTYVNDKQRSLEGLFSALAGAELTITPVEPISFELSEAALLQIAPKEWLLEKAGIDIQPPVDPATGQPVQPAAEVMVNENVKNLTGRQHQQLLRIIRQFGQGKITREIATTLLKTSLGLSDDEIVTMLNIDEEFSEADEMSVFAEYGEPRTKFVVHHSRGFQFKEDVIDEEVDKKILGILNNQPLTPPKDIAKALRVPLEEVNARLNKLVDLEVIKVDPKTGARRLREPIKKIVDTPTTTTFEIRYSYEWKPEVPTSQRDSDEHPSRPFCAKLMELDRFWTRTEIETISRRLGYSVFDRGGGWWGKSPSCRHRWVSNIVVRKKEEK